MTVDIAQDANRILDLKGESLPIEGSIQPTLIINKICNVAVANSAANSTGVTIYTTPTDKDFYLTGFCVGVIKDVTSTSTYTGLNVTINGTLRQLIRIPSITLTVQNDLISVQLTTPIKLDRNTACNVTATTNVANINISGSIFGYTAETTKGT